MCCELYRSITGLIKIEHLPCPGIYVCPIRWKGSNRYISLLYKKGIHHFICLIHCFKFMVCRGRCRGIVTDLCKLPGIVRVCEGSPLIPLHYPDRLWMALWYSKHEHINSPDNQGTVMWELECLWLHYTSYVLLCMHWWHCLENTFFPQKLLWSV